MPWNSSGVGPGGITQTTTVTAGPTNAPLPPYVIIQTAQISKIFMLIHVHVNNILVINISGTAGRKIPMLFDCIFFFFFYT